MLRELRRSAQRALPIIVGVAGPVFVASLALLAWAGVPPMRAVVLPWRLGLPVWSLQTLAAAWPLWALRRRLLPEAWCAQLHCLPLPGRALWASDLAVSAVILAPLAGLYLLSVFIFAVQRPAWWLAVWPRAVGALAASWLLSCGLGAAALAARRSAPWWRALPAHRPAGHRARAETARVPFVALLWAPLWRGTLSPGGPGVLVALAAVAGLAAGWFIDGGARVPGAAWAAGVGGLLIALTERLQRTLEDHLDRLDPWLRALPVEVPWRAAARGLVVLPMAVAGLAVAGAAVAFRPWRAGAVAAYAVTALALPAWMSMIPSARREAHVGLWAVGLGVMTALGSELWT